MATRLILVGGFLGAGKTTLLVQAARILAASGKRVGLVTNDQGTDLVDTALAQAQTIPVEEVAGGCFCCRFPDLIQAVRRLQEVIEPDIILAEPVGSCTDLVATVVRPLQAYHAIEVEVAPLTVLIDPQRDLKSFPATVDYLYRQQLAEAEIIALTKIDLLSDQARSDQLAELGALYPHAEVLGISARLGTGVDPWLKLIERQLSKAARALSIDYTLYAEAEASLGWLNASGVVQSDRAFSADAWMAGALHALDHAFTEQGAAIAHIKLQLETTQATLKASLTQSGAPVSWDLLPADVRTDHARLLLNARVRTDPATLEAIVRRMAAETPSWIECTLTHLECFSPLPPEPTYRLGGAVD